MATERAEIKQFDIVFANLKAVSHFSRFIVNNICERIIQTISKNL